MAGHFLDYEPGIHYPQAQMQAGTTGINTFRCEGAGCTCAGQGINHHWEAGMQGAAACLLMHLR